MKHHFKIRISITLILFIMIFLSACSEATIEPLYNNTVKITICTDEYYTADQYVYYVERGASLTVELNFTDGYSISGCGYDGYICRQTGNLVTLTLPNVLYPSRVDIETCSVDGCINYYLNGGNFVDGSESLYYSESYDISHHLRANTSIGADIYRDNCTLVGWNTMADGSGEHIGLGSRVTVSDIKILYAEWSEWTNAEYFTYESAYGGVSLSGYSGGDREVLSIPAEIDGNKVVAISEGFADGVTIGKLVFANTIETVVENAFTNCSIDELYICDNITHITDSSFGNEKIPTFHINAVQKPAYQSGNELAYFADIMDRLILNKDSKKLIFFSGCSFAYGMDSTIADTHFGGEYTVINLGIVGGTNANFQFDCISAYLCEGDIFVHAPEVCSEYQLMDNLTAESRMYVMCEGNYDLLSLVDMSAIPEALDAFAVFNRSKLQLDDGEYGDYCDCYNEYGDNITSRPYEAADLGYSDGEYTYNPDLINDKSMAALESYYQKITEKGARVLVSYSPVNKTNLLYNDLNGKIWLTFADKLEYYLSKIYGYEIISEVTDYLYLGRYFYDTDYHLNEAGVVLRTEQLLKDLDNYLK